MDQVENAKTFRGTCRAHDLRRAQVLGSIGARARGIGRRDDGDTIFRKSPAPRARCVHQSVALVDQLCVRIDVYALHADIIHLAYTNRQARHWRRDGARHRILTAMSIAATISTLQHFIDRYPRLLVLTGAGCSTASGIPAYRDDFGNWQHRTPVQHRDFIRNEATRRRYWARSLTGWPYVARAQPNAAHHALAALEILGHLQLLVTQNVDGLHQKAGSRAVLDLHGRLDDVECLACGLRSGRAELQEALCALNPSFTPHGENIAPDGDTELSDECLAEFQVPACQRCGGVLKPTVVFFGENVAAAVVDRVREALHQAAALLVIGSSLTVYSGYRFVRAAIDAGKPVAVLNRGRTRADEDATFKINADCDVVLPALLAALAPPGSLNAGTC